MSNPKSAALSTAAREAVLAYELRLFELIDSCADHQAHDPEVFLWNARRALEAICHLLLTVHSGEPSRVKGQTTESSLDGMIKGLRKAGVLDAQQTHRFDLARSHTNLGVHIQQPEREDYASAVDDTAHVLPGLLDWLYEDSIAVPYLKRPKDIPIDVLREGGRPGPSLKDAATAARHERLAAERTENTLRKTLTQQSIELEKREARWWRWTTRMVVASAGSLAVGLCMGALASPLLPNLWTSSPAAGPKTLAAAGAATELKPEPPASIAAAPTAPAPAAALGAPVAAPPEPTPPPAPAPTLTCPSDMLLIPARVGMLLAQPIGGRKNWPRPAARQLEPVDVPSFCLHAAPVPRAALDTTSFNALEARGCERLQPEAERPTGRNCLSREEAEGWCASHVPTGRLAGLLEWESAVRAELPKLEWPTNEWTGERFPPAALARFDPNWSLGNGMWVGRLRNPARTSAADGSLLLAWNQQAPEKRHAERTFRCAATPTPE